MTNPTYFRRRLAAIRREVQELEAILELQEEPAKNPAKQGPFIRT